MSRRYTYEFRCVGTRADRHQCRRTVRGVSDDSDAHAEQAAVDRAVLSDWGPADRWDTAVLRGLLCPRHA